MPDKIVRDELLRSHRYVSVSNDTAKLLFVHLLLSSDNLGNAEATPTAINIAMGRVLSEEAQGAMLAELHDRDLVRLYQVEGKRYVHIPRQRQRMRYLNGKHPRPPESLEDRNIKELLSKVGPTTGEGQTVTARSEVLGSEVKRSDVRKAVAPTPSDKPVENPSASASNGHKAQTPFGKFWHDKAKELGIQPQRGESDRDFINRVRDVVAQEKH